MLRMLLAGPALLAIVHACGSILADDARQVVHQRPSKVYASASEAIAGNVQSGIMQLEGGKPVHYRVAIDRTPGQRLVLHLLFDGEEGGEAAFDFVPQQEGRETMIVAKVTTDGAVLRRALAGTDQAKLGYAPDWTFNIGMRQRLRDFAAQVEQGAMVGGAST